MDINQKVEILTSERLENLMEKGEMLVTKMLLKVLFPRDCTNLGLVCMDYFKFDFILFISLFFRKKLEEEFGNHLCEVWMIYMNIYNFSLLPVFQKKRKNSLLRLKMCGELH